MNLKNFKEIVNGYTNYAFPTPTIKQLADERARICSSCPHIEPNALLKVIMPDNTEKEIQGSKCGICKCPLSAKVRSVFSSCPEGKWS